MPTALENDCDAAALAEAAWGTGSHVSTFLYVTISTGIGVGILLNGKIYRGSDGSHPELGHHTLDASGPACYCGATGCWESLASGNAIAHWLINNQEYRSDPTFDPQVSTRNICALARAGHPLAMRAIGRLSHYLGLGLANLVTMFVPDVIALGGGVMESSDLFLDDSRSITKSRCRLVPAERIKIEVASLGRSVALLGAARTGQLLLASQERCGCKPT